MRIFKTWTILFFALCIFCQNSNSQTFKDVTLKKAGTLHKQIKKKEMDAIVSLSVSGEISTEDIDFINGLTNLKTVNLLHTTFKSETKHRLRDDWPSGIANFSNNLDSLLLPKECRDFKVAQQSLKYLEGGFEKLPQGLFVSKLKLNPVVYKQNQGFLNELGERDYTEAKVDTIVLDNLEALSTSNIHISANVIQTIKEGYRILLRYKGTEESVILDDKYILLAREAFKGCNSIKHISISSKYLNSIRTSSFEGCKNLQSVELSAPISVISSKAFYGCSSLDRININSPLLKIGQYAFAGCSKLQNITLPTTLAWLSYTAFSECNGLKTIEFTGTNECVKITEAYEKSFNYWDFGQSEEKMERLRYGDLEPVKKEITSTYGNTDIIIPKGLYRKYQQEEYWESVSVLEKGTIKQSHLKFTIDKPGTIMSYIKPNQFSQIDSLTIEGILYETDMDVINKCKRLSYINLANTIIMKSPDAQKAENEEKQAVAFIFGMMGAVADAKYNDYQLSTMDHNMIKMLAELANESAKSSKPIKDCIIPSGSLSKMPRLKTVILPKTASLINSSFNDCPQLQSVELPLCLNSIVESFNNCISLRNVCFPKTLCFLTGFKNCSSITSVDLSMCVFSREDWRGAFKDCSKLRVIKFPEGIKRIDSLFGYEEIGLNEYKNFETEFYFPKSLTQFNEVNVRRVKIHFKTQTPPSGRLSKVGNFGDCTIYCPKGTTTAYYSKYKDAFEYIEE